MSKLSAFYQLAQTEYSPQQRMAAKRAVIAAFQPIGQRHVLEESDVQLQLILAENRRHATVGSRSCLNDIYCSAPVDWQKPSTRKQLGSGLPAPRKLCALAYRQVASYDFCFGLGAYWPMIVSGLYAIIVSFITWNTVVLST